ncbi:MAG: HDIG domain-containing protein [Deltaproteobacteria bacterium]|nr:HDIG domain-containing protein [Deltaproteobacteria bacterium]
MKKLSARIYANLPIRILIAVIFALLSALIQYVEIIKPAYTVTAGEPAPVTLRMPPAYFRITMLRNEFYYNSAAIQGCQEMVPIGSVVEKDSECAGMVDAFENSRRPINIYKVAGSFVMFLLIALMISAHMSKDGMGRSRWVRTQITVLGLIVFMLAISKFILLFTPFSFQILPVALVPLLVSMLLGKRLSFAAALASALMASSLVNFNVQALFIFLVSGTSSAVAANTFKKRTFKLLKSGVIVSVVVLLATVLSTLLFLGTLDIYEDIFEHINPINSIWLLSLYGGIGASIIASILLPLIGLAVGEAPRARLVDLLELDHPLLKKLMDKAPSTWEHSRAMANLGEAAAHAINGNALLVRVGAYFHDVGKSLNPNFFIENQKGENPHDEMAPYDSARAIFSHVTEGTKLLRKHGVPEDVVSFAYTHHGTSVLEYFWMKNMALGNTDKLSESDFSYPGHKPASRETAILMIVDAVEAAARTIDKPDRKKFTSLVQTIVFGKMIQGQFDDSGLAMHDLRIAIITIIDSLESMYHSRIKYPWQNTDGENSDNKKIAEVTGSVETVGQSETVGQTETIEKAENVDNTEAIDNEENQTNDKKPAPIDNTTGSVIIAPVIITAKPATETVIKDVEKGAVTLAPDSPVVSGETTYTGPAPVK